ncbi:hypothetical protein Tco_0791163 [Tanacetum coccineum]
MTKRTNKGSRLDRAINKKQLFQTVEAEAVALHSILPYREVSKDFTHTALPSKKGLGVVLMQKEREDHQIKQMIQTARDRQKSYADLKRKPMEFQVGDKVMLKVSPWKGVVRSTIRFHVSNLKKCYSDDPLVVPLEGLQVDDKLHFVEEPVKIMDREVKQLSEDGVPIVKVRGTLKAGPEFTWNEEDQFRKKYPHLSPRPAHVFKCLS